MSIITQNSTDEVALMKKAINPPSEMGEPAKPKRYLEY